MEDIKAVIFDLGGVILDIDYDSTAKAFSRLGVTGFDKMYSQKNANSLFQKLERGKVTETEFYAEFRKTANIDLSDEQIKKAWNAMLLSFRKKTLRAISDLKSKYKLYLLSNTNIIHLQAFSEIFTNEIGSGSLDDYFDKIYYSHEIGFRKPDKESFEFVVKENNLLPAKTLFIDDSIQNIEAAEKSGLKTVFLKKDMQVENLGL